jgi:hypothetical protein
MFRLSQSNSKLGAEVDAKNGGLEFEFNVLLRCACNDKTIRG